MNSQSQERAKLKPNILFKNYNEKTKKSHLKLKLRPPESVPSMNRNLSLPSIFKNSPYIAP